MTDKVSEIMALVDKYHAATTQTFREGADETDDANLNRAYRAIESRLREVVAPPVPEPGKLVTVRFPTLTPEQAADVYWCLTEAMVDAERADDVRMLFFVGEATHTQPASEPVAQTETEKVCAVCGGSDWLPGCFADHLPTLCMTCLGKNRQQSAPDGWAELQAEASDEGFETVADYVGNLKLSAAAYFAARNTRATPQPASEPVARIVSSGPNNFPLLQWLSPEHSFRAPIGSLLYAGPKEDQHDLF
jgi:hypothetical protein